MSVSERFKNYTSKVYADQGKAFLNAYWKECGDQAEDVWKYVEMMSELDQQKGKEGNDLDEFASHRFLEKLDETKTVKQMREELKEADLDFNKRLALVEYLCWKNKKKISDFVDRPQGPAEELQKYTDMLNRVQKALDEAISKAKEAEEQVKNAKQKEKEAQEAKEKSIQRTQEAKENEKKAAEAVEEMKAALAEVQAQEDAYNNKTAELKAKTETGGVVSKNKAKAELASHLSEDPLPLSRAKITQEAATKKSEKAKKVAEESRAKAEQAEQAAKEAAERASESRKAAENASEEANQAVEAAQAEVEDAARQLEEAKASSSAGQGNIWWAERELEEKRRYMPKKKGGTW